MTEFYYSFEPKINFYQNNGKRKLLRRKGATCDPNLSISCVRHDRGSVMVWECMAANRTGSLVFIEDVTVEIRSKMNS